MTTDERNQLVEANQGLVFRCIEVLWPKLRRNAGRFDREDLQQVGYLALLRAAELFDPSRGTKFSSYAYPAIIRAMLRNAEEQRLIAVPINRQRAVRHGTPDHAAALAITCAAMGHEPTGGSEPPGMGSIPDREEPDGNADLFLAYDRLTEAEQNVLAEYFGLFGRVPNGPDAMATASGVSRMTILKRIHGALDRLRNLYLREKYDL